MIEWGGNDLDWAAQFLSNSRLKHVERVVLLAVELCRRHQLPCINAVKRAGALHDIAKFLSPEQLTAIGIPSDMRYSRLYQAYQPVWHAFAGAAMVKYLDVCQDHVILSAIKWHTTGRPDMTTVEQVIFVADFCEPGRGHPLAKAVAEIAHQSLDLATAIISQFLVKTIRSENCFSATIKCAEFYQRTISKKDATIVRSCLNIN